jgi:glycosyltransferase involved in cell wall biosynthesis
MEDALAVRNAIALIHHPTALETGFSEADRAALLAIEKRLLPRFARVIVTSEATVERLVADFSVDPERIKVVVPGTDDAPRSVGSGGPTCRIISVGALVARKGHDVLLRALARLFDLDWQLTIVGSPDRDPVHARTLAAMAEELGIAHRVRFAGEVSDAALEALWREADLFALATHWEGYGMAVAEALKRGLPVAVCGGGAAGTLVTAESGVVCQPGDHINLSKALRRLIFAASLRRDLAEAAWRVGQSLPSWQAQAREFAQALAG